MHYDFLDDDFFLDEDFFFEDFFFGTFPPAFRASDNPIAIACFLLVTFWESVSDLSRSITRDPVWFEDLETPLGRRKIPSINSR